MQILELFLLIDCVRKIETLTCKSKVSINFLDINSWVKLSFLGLHLKHVLSISLFLCGRASKLGSKKVS